MGSYSDDILDFQTADEPLGRRLIPHIIDKASAIKPDAECFQVPRSGEPADGWQVVTWKQYAGVIDGIAKRIVEVCGPAAKGEFPVISYIGPNDARYVAFLVSAVKAGYQAFFISPRNSPEGQLHLLQSVDCKIVSTPSLTLGMIKPWLAARPSMKIIEIPPLEELISQASTVPPFPYNRTFEEGRWDPLCTLHSSGTTGMPKPIIVRQGAMALRDGQQMLETWKGKRHVFDLLGDEVQRLFLPVPLFHAGALYTFIGLNIFQNMPSIFGIGGKFPSGEFMTECLENMDASGASLAPFILETMMNDERALKQLSKLKIVIYGGGSLNQEAGEALKARGVSLLNVIASTEASTPPSYEVDTPELWNYFHINPNETGVEWRPQSGEEDVYELVFVKTDRCTHVNQSVFYIFPEATEYATSDLFRKHPTVPDHWLYQGRADNIIVFSNGEKLNPISIEEGVGRSELLKSALVVGQAKFQPAMILDPITHPKNDAETRKLVNDVWPFVVKMNKETVGHGQILKSLIGVSNPGKPFPLTAKGTIKRQAAAKLYEDEINQLYENNSKPLSLEAPHLDVSSEEALTQSILDVFDTRIGSTCLDENADFYAAGIDSLQMILAARLLRGGIEASGLTFDVELIKPSTIYGNPTPRRLARYILSSANSSDDADARVISAMQQLLDKYSQDFTPGTTVGKTPRFRDAQTVVLTGSTGTFGCYLLHDLLQDPTVSRVICLNRSEGGGRQRQPTLMAARGLTTDLAVKAEFFRIDVTKPDLGLAPSALETILESADHIIHAAWAVNFNVSVESMEPHVAGVRHIIDMAVRCKKRVNVATTSSAGAFDRWDVATKGPAVPEETLDDLMIASNGYCQSKILGNILLEKGARIGGFDATIARIGQIAGPLGEKGFWNKNELFPSLVESSIELGALPKGVGLLNRVDWLPLEVASRTILDTVIVAEEGFDDAEGRGHVRIVHCANPAATTFDQLTPAIQEFFGTDRISEVLGFKEWIEKLEARALEDPASVARLPAFKLIDTFRSVLVPEGEERQPVYLETTRTKERSQALRDAGPVTTEMMKHWCAQWRL
ncbi:hypothetical protein F5X68DRAFT_175463 [Plectosphaerella plurivora]|uniref:Carrier domain-containing protein n=1 Tax=Plectosphaerella plurivora TaxID=936078 RepID=A0A9P8V4Q1_9PEZI|nr:hypothetical protein F5X68DRAFT_175463 [Plectosphaerella plurivora]